MLTRNESTATPQTAIVTKSEADRLAQDIAEHYAAFKSGTTAALYAALQVGEQLSRLKSGLPHGKFQSHIAENFDFSYRWAAAAMKIAGRWLEIEAKVQTSALLSFDGALRILADIDQQKREPEDVEPLTEEEQERLAECESAISAGLELQWPVEGPVPVAEGRVRVAIVGDVTYMAWTVRGESDVCLLERNDGDGSNFTRRPIYQHGAAEFMQVVWEIDPAELLWWERDEFSLPLTPIGHHPFCQCCDPCREFTAGFEQETAA